MPVRLENVSDRPVRLDLPSGQSLRLSPGQSSPPLATADVGQSSRVDKLVARGVVVVRGNDQQVTSPSTGRRPRGPRAAASAPSPDENP